LFLYLTFPRNVDEIDGEFNMAIQLNVEPLINAVQRLDEGQSRYQKDESDIQIRDGLVKRFEFTYELSHKMLKRYLELNSANPTQQMTFADLIRTGNEQGVLASDWMVWKNFREMRSSTSHAYDEAIALKVVSGIPDFLEEVKFLLHQLQVRSK
jgi:nucleotidyltransferase substrate binding protein (TIGR01987 family)